MDSIIIGLKTVLAFPLTRTAILVWFGLFVLICLFSVATATVPDRKLYSAGKDGARKAPLRAILESYETNPDKWLFYEEEIFYVRDPETLEGEKREAYERARVRCVNGGAEAREVGSRIRLRRTDTQAYLKFFYGLHREKEAPAAKRRRKGDDDGDYAEAPEKIGDEDYAEAPEEIGDGDYAETPEEIGDGDYAEAPDETDDGDYAEEDAEE